MIRTDARPARWASSRKRSRRARASRARSPITRSSCAAAGVSDAAARGGPGAGRGLVAGRLQEGPAFGFEGAQEGPRLVEVGDPACTPALLELGDEATALALELGERATFVDDRVPLILETPPAGLEA